MSPCKVKPKWSTADIPDLSGKNVLITGATGGLGFQTATALAAHNAKVYVGGRNAEKGADAVAKIKEQTPSAQVEFAKIDHIDLKSVEEFAKSYNAKGQALGKLYNGGVHRL